VRRCKRAKGKLNVNGNKAGGDERQRRGREQRGKEIKEESERRETKAKRKRNRHSYYTHCVISTATQCRKALRPYQHDTFY